MTNRLGALLRRYVAPQRKRGTRGSDGAIDVLVRGIDSRSKRLAGRRTADRDGACTDRRMLITLAALAVIPLFILTRVGKG